MPAEDVAALLDRWGRARTRSQQLQVAAAGARTLRASTPGDRRVLARALAEHGVPQVAAQLEATSAGPLSARDLNDLTGALRQVDPATLERVAAAVADPAEHQRLLAGTDDRQEAEPGHLPPPPTGPALELPPPTDEDVITDPRAFDPPAFDPEGFDPEGFHAEEADLDAPVLDEVPRHGREVDHEQVPAELQDPGEVTAGDAAHAPTGGDRQPTEADQPSPTLDAGEVLHAIERAPRVLDRLREVTDHAGEPLRGDDLVTILRALPDGWQRRRAAKRLLAAGGVRDVDPAQVLDAFGRASDRTAVARALVTAGLTDVATVGSLLPAAATSRLRAAAPRT